MKKLRADEILVKRALVESRSKAQAFILAGEVYVRKVGSDSPDAWQPVLKPSQSFTENFDFQIRSKSLQDVGRGALKLRGALAAWSTIPVQGARCLDIGASTGGFTQVLLEAGAAHVVALDVGTHQLHERLRKDPRVLSMEQQHILHVSDEVWKKAGVQVPFDLFVTDLSFISVEKVIAEASRWLRVGGHWVLLLKPQFELDRSHLHKGIVKEESSRQLAVSKIRTVVDSLPRLKWVDMITSPIEGGDGNIEFLVHLERVG